MPYDNKESERYKRAVRKMNMKISSDMTTDPGKFHKWATNPMDTTYSVRTDAEFKKQAKAKLRKKATKAVAKTTAKAATKAVPIVGTAIAAAEAGYAVGALARKGYDAYQNKKTLKTLDKLAKESSKKTKKGSK